MPPVDQLFAQALQHHQSGRIAEAAAQYRDILARNPNHADSLHLLGVTAYQRQAYAEAEALLRKAISLQADKPAYYSNLGITLRELDRIPEAETCFRKAVALNPNYAEAFCNLGVALEEQNRFEEAEEVCRTAIALRPNYPEAHHNLGLTLKGQRRYPEAEACMRQAIALSPNYAKAHSNLGVILKDTDQIDEAYLSFGRALLLDPHSPETHLNLSNMLRDERHYPEALGAAEETVRLKPDSALSHLCLGNAQDALRLYEDAEKSFRRALELNPDFPEAYSNLGNSLKDMGRYEEAEEACRAAIRLKPNRHQSHSNLGNVFKERNQLDEALACYDKAIELDPTYAQGRLNRGITRMLAGRIAEGWDDYEWRWKMRDWPQPPRHQHLPAWTGDAARGRTILVWPEQGLGDLIQFIRYVPHLTATGWKVVLEAPTALTRLFSRIPQITVVPYGANTPPCDVQCPIMSLPHIMATPAENPFLSSASYLTTDPTDRQKWQAVLAGRPGLKVGFVWRGNPALLRDAKRSLPATAFAPMMSLPGLCPVILQKDVRRDELEALSLPPHAVIGGPNLTDFADTAALIQNLDLVISVDTSVCHLAGAVGVPVWTLIEFACDWRWMLNRQDTPWYPSMRLFRQKSPLQWEDALIAAHQALKDLPR